MWSLLNKTAYAAERNWLRDEQGAHWWLVAVRATFKIGPGGKLRLADEQLSPTLVPEYSGKAGESSLLCDSDLLGRKPTTDILLIGSANAPGGRPAPSVPVVLRVGALEKYLVVYGERLYRVGLSGLTTTAPRPFVSRPIHYELAFGGGDFSDPDPIRHRIDERNPIGLGFGQRWASLVDKPAHGIEYPTGDPATRGPAGFGPIDAGWLPRRKLAGTYDSRWAETKRPLLPDDYDPTFALSAPADQRPLRPLQGGERVELQNMSPQGTLVFELPRIQLAFVSRFGSYKTPHDAPRLATVLLEPDASRVSLVWQSALRVAATEGDFLDATEIEERRAT